MGTEVSPQITISDCTVDQHEVLHPHLCCKDFQVQYSIVLYSRHVQSYHKRIMTWSTIIIKK